MLKTILIAFFSFVSIFFILMSVFFFRLGGLEDVHLSEAERSFSFLYKKKLGAYHKILDTLNEVEAWAKENGINCKNTFAYFLDDPDSTPEDRLRSEVGCVVDKKVSSLPKDFLFKAVPRKKYLKAEFSGSPAIGIFKVLPLAKAWFDKRSQKTPVDYIEIYHIQDDSVRTEYYFNI